MKKKRNLWIEAGTTGVPEDVEKFIPKPLWPPPVQVQQQSFEKTRQSAKKHQHQAIDAMMLANMSSKTFGILHDLVVAESMKIDAIESELEYDVVELEKLMVQVANMRIKE